MKQLRPALYLASHLGLFWPLLLYAEGAQNSVAVFYPGKSWYLRYELDGVLEQYNNHKAAVSTYAFAVSETTGARVSAQINPADKATTAVQCRDNEYATIRKNKGFGNPEVKFTDKPAADMEVVYPESGDKDQPAGRHLHRYWIRDGVCAKVHVSKSPFAERDRPGLAAILASARFEPVPAAGFERAFAIPGRGTLLVRMPPAWGFRTTRPGKATPREITFMEPTDENRLLFTLFPDAARVLKDDITVRQFVEKARDTSRDNAVEKDPALQDLKGAAGSGHYFTVTDKNLVGRPGKPEDWKYLTQGALTVGESFLVFSFFSNSKEGPMLDQALLAVREARFVGP